MRRLLASLLQRLWPRAKEPEVEAIDHACWERPSNGKPCILSPEQIDLIHDRALCPYCKSRHGLYEGPKGGASINLFCGNPDCDSRFNVIDPKFGRVPVGQFMGSCPKEYIQGRRKKLGSLH